MGRVEKSSPEQSSQAVFACFRNVIFDSFFISKMYHYTFRLFAPSPRHLKSKTADINIT